MHADTPSYWLRWFLAMRADTICRQYDYARFILLRRVEMPALIISYREGTPYSPALAELPAYEMLATPPPSRQPRLLSPRLVVEIQFCLF